MSIYVPELITLTEFITHIYFTMLPHGLIHLQMRQKFKWHDREQHSHVEAFQTMLKPIDSLKLDNLGSSVNLCNNIDIAV